MQNQILTFMKVGHKLFDCISKTRSVKKHDIHIKPKSDKLEVLGELII